MPLSRLERRDEDEPRDRLSRIAAAMLKAAEEHPEAREDDQALVMLDSPSERRGTIAHGGFEGVDADAFVNLLGHVDALAQAQGIRMEFIPMSEPPGQG